MNATGTAGLFRLTLARACAWALLVAGWIGIGALALRLAPSIAAAFALVALWLLALGAAATVATRGGLSRGARAAASIAAGVVTAAALQSIRSGGGLLAVGVALAGWATLTALASGVVRVLRRSQPAPLGPPLAAATLGALVAGLVLGDVGDLAGLAARLTIFVFALALVLLALQWRLDTHRPAPGCRAGLFDCSLPAWPRGAWRDSAQWPTLIAGLAMLPMMAW